MCLSLSLLSLRRLQPNTELWLDPHRVDTKVTVEVQWLRQLFHII